MVDAVKRIAKTDFKVELGSRRPGDPTHIVARCDRIRSALGWRPQYGDLDTMVAHALAWERKLMELHPEPQ